MTTKSKKKDEERRKVSDSNLKILKSEVIPYGAQFWAQPIRLKRFEVAQFARVRSILEIKLWDKIDISEFAED